METGYTDEENIRPKSISSELDLQSDSFYFVQNHRLPVETLETIFIHCARDHHQDNCGLSSRTAPGWTNISYVCRYWRDIAMNCPTLWTYLFVTSPRWTEELLARSKQAPLKVHVNIDSLDGPPELGFLKKVMSHVDRVQEFHLHLPALFSLYPHHALCSIFSVFRSRAARLQNLMISATYICPGWESLSLVLFNGDTPALRALDLVYCPVPWYSFKLTGLTTLSLRYDPTRLQQDIAEFLVKLECMQQLTCLYLDDALPSASGFLCSAAFHTLRNIALPHLSRLLIVAPVSSVIAFLSRIAIPSKTELRLQCLAEYGFSDYYLLSELLAQRFALSGDQAVLSSTIHSSVIKLNWGLAILTFGTSERDSTIYRPDMEWNCNVPLEIILDFERSMKERDHVVGDLYGALPLQSVQRVHVITPPLSSAFWSKTLGRLQDLRYLKLSEGYMPDLTPLLSLAAHDPMDNRDGNERADRGPNRLLAPALEHMELRNISFSTSQDSVVPPSADLQRLCDVLASRKVPRGRLTMTRCSIVERLVEFDMVGEWKDGRFHIVEEYNRLSDELDGSDADPLFTEG